jgi:hypothetical protein
MWAAGGDAQMILRAQQNHNHDSISEAVWQAIWDAAPAQPSALPEAGREAELRDLLDDIVVHEVEEDDRVHLRIGSVFIGAFRGIKAASLLKFDAEQRALLSPSSKEIEHG